MGPTEVKLTSAAPAAALGPLRLSLPGGCLNHSDALRQWEVDFPRNRRAADLDRQADLHLSEGRDWIAERLSVRAEAMRTEAGR